MSLYRRMGLWLKSVISCVKNTPTRFGQRQVTCSVPQAQKKDGLILEEDDIELVSNSAALIQQATTVKSKGIRKFLDGSCI